MMVASTMVPVEMRMPLARQIQVHRIQDLATQLMRLQQAAKTKDPGLIGAAARPRSTPAKRRSTGDSYIPSSAPGSERLNHCCKK
jgi:hypothetical protein